MLKLTGSTMAILTEGMGGRMKRKNGQLRALKHRTTPQQRQARNVRIAARRTVAAKLLRNQQLFAGAMNHFFFSRGFFGRMKWVLVGR